MIRTLSIYGCLSGWLLLTAAGGTFAQSASGDGRWATRGYLKYLHTTTFLDSRLVGLPLPTDRYQSNDLLLHNRYNLRFRAGGHINLVAEIRNRIFWGDQVRTLAWQGQDFTDQLQADDYLRLSRGWQGQAGIAFHTVMDRLYGEFHSEGWEIRVGRQRINWGIGTVWNPHDIFNTFNFTDFDYEERPGSDAVRIRRFRDAGTGWEVAVRAADRLAGLTAGSRWNFHLGTYDLQFIGGVFREHIVAGAGWAGNLGASGFKGEWAWFQPWRTTGRAGLSASLGVDHTWSNQFYLHGGFLLNTRGSTRAGITELTRFQPSALQLYPYRYALLTQVLYPVSPLLRSGFVLVYSPGQSQGLFLNPLLTYSLAEDWDLDLVGQLFVQRTGGRALESPIQSLFLRTKWSF